jgi:hypothetical protein
MWHASSTDLAPFVGLRFQNTIAWNETSCSAKLWIVYHNKVVVLAAALRHPSGRFGKRRRIQLRTASGPSQG